MAYRKRKKKLDYKRNRGYGSRVGSLLRGIGSPDFTRTNPEQQTRTTYNAIKRAIHGV